MKRLLRFWWVSAIGVLLLGNALANDKTDTIPLEYFGMHIHRADSGTAWPNVPFGSWRLWDAYVGWANLEPARGKWDFSRLDRYVAMAGITKVDILLPLAMTPNWASARPTEASAYKPGNVAEPARIEDWTNYVSTIGQRYKGKIKHYEIWNEPSDRTHYSGDIPTLVQLTCEASRVLKQIDPAIRIVSPASAGGGRHIEYLDKFLSAGGKECVDIIAHHFYVFKEPPEAMVPLIRQVKAVMQKNGVAEMPLWNTETGWWLASSDGTPDHPMVAKGWNKIELNTQSGEYIQQALLLARAEGVGRFYWYAWDNHSLGLINPTIKEPKPATGAWRSLVEKMHGGTAPHCAATGKKWACTFASRNGEKHQITWTAK